SRDGPPRHDKGHYGRTVEPINDRTTLKNRGQIKELVSLRVDTEVYQDSGVARATGHHARPSSVQG
ncbi:hypothetical protein ABZS88_47070, partial [Streptomyces sp. NPDC005480]|uniref:hypothetical protein n=1 Tax=Streptomyces sp. NPDC005480 TaxID=3154880 RepID=UPI0033B46C03